MTSFHEIYNWPIPTSPALIIRFVAVALSCGDTSYSPAQLVGIATAGDTVSNGVLTGISLGGLLGGSDNSMSTTTSAVTTTAYGQIVTPSGANSNPNFDLRYFVTGTGSNGTTAVSRGQIEPGFVGTGQTVPFIAYQTAGDTLRAAPRRSSQTAPNRNAEDGREAIFCLGYGDDDYRCER